MENAEEIYHYLEEFSKRKPKVIPQELNEYLAYVARTGDPVYQWSLVKSLFKEKLLTVITEFYETSPGIDIPPYPNVDPFNFDIMKNSLLERLDSFTSAPFTVQRICELLTYPRKQYNRVDKFMRAIEKNILVVSTREPGVQRHPEPENGEPVVNGSDNNSEYNVDVEMEDMSWKENAEQQTTEPQPGSSDAHISVDDIEARLKAKQDAAMDVQEKSTAQYESVTPPELNVTADEPADIQEKSNDAPQSSTADIKEHKMDTDNVDSTEKSKSDTDVKSEVADNPTGLIIPEIKVDDVDITEEKLRAQSANMDNITEPNVEKETSAEAENKNETPSQPIMTVDENSMDSKDKPEIKIIAEVSSSSEDSSSSSDNMDSSSNSPKPETHINTHEVSQNEKNSQENTEPQTQIILPVRETDPNIGKVALESDNYSISDVNSVLTEPQVEITKVQDNTSNEEDKNATSNEIEYKEEQKDEVSENSDPDKKS
ncbi:serine/threonine-protein phosphatase 4 regulatory subunit 2 [Manduca sexta]|uniref:serine/threonine-protein phosphatase 4 regulatory subunit 2 n=1 Tax=Manduca sexta TaxID=7130 RepID=UPI00188E93FD|nr:serine/threonine-protein phosphatase 4 regulatory subunit 2 [Manduca sexta]